MSAAICPVCTGTDDAHTDDRCPLNGLPVDAWDTVAPSREDTPDDPFRDALLADGFEDELDEPERKGGPRGGPCNHYKCHRYFTGGCRMLDEAALEITPDDETLAVQLVAEGWLSVSTKFRHLIRWKVPPPAIVDMIDPAYRGTYFAARLARQSHAVIGEWALRDAPDELVEKRTLTIGQHRAFRHMRDRPRKEEIARRVAAAKSERLVAEGK